MGKKLLIVNTYANLWSTGRIAAEIGEIAVKHGWQCYFAYASESNPCSCRSEEHTSELQSPVPISYAVFGLKKLFMGVAY